MFSKKSLVLFLMVASLVILNATVFAQGNLLSTEDLKNSNGNLMTTIYIEGPNGNLPTTVRVEDVKGNLTSTEAVNDKQNLSDEQVEQIMEQKKVEDRIQEKKQQQLKEKKQNQLKKQEKKQTQKKEQKRLQKKEQKQQKKQTQEKKQNKNQDKKQNKTQDKSGENTENGQGQSGDQGQKNVDGAQAPVDLTASATEVIKKIGVIDETEDGYVIECDGVQYKPLNLQEKFQVAGLEVIFAAELLQGEDVEENSISILKMSSNENLEEDPVETEETAQEGQIIKEQTGSQRQQGKSSNLTNDF